MLQTCCCCYETTDFRVGFMFLCHIKGKSKPMSSGYSSQANITTFGKMLKTCTSFSSVHFIRGVSLFKNLFYSKSCIDTELIFNLRNFVMVKKGDLNKPYTQTQTYSKCAIVYMLCFDIIYLWNLIKSMIIKFFQDAVKLCNYLAAINELQFNEMKLDEHIFVFCFFFFGCSLLPIPQNVLCEMVFEYNQF